MAEVSWGGAVKFIAQVKASSPTMDANYALEGFFLSGLFDDIRYALQEDFRAGSPETLTIEIKLEKSNGQT